MTANTSRLLAILGAIVAAAALRLLPHSPNFSPIYAMALFGGAYFGRSALALAAPLGALLLSDLVLGFYPHMEITYLAFAMIVPIGWLVSTRKTPLRIGLAALASAILFYAITNFGVWIFSGIYPMTVAGLAACYVAAIPFFQNTLVSDLFFAALLFGGFALLERFVPALREHAPQAA
jgi:hypothetical protein